ncbi:MULTISPECIES: BolA family protein [Ramlibacter]|uniref:BolA/IbaG family iron-sulfur metabolism protein n=1 Tax=Ramlibacter pinisoli TaxID=2682844 RepID=A0A6N8IV90_9BURK|nr:MULTISPECIES: BolA family protein [Ramlibacter]MBA2960770.1 BolA family transcriptional regulator [Ramlibacter sp. CGMCC 1.13660]MVQ30718.1 BolA/IbaG family iron-sulfur metabolism protein [Ramlibacter pinisoli]
MSGTGITATALEARLRERLAPSRLEVVDESAAHLGHAGSDGTGSGTHFRVRIDSPLFAGRPRVARHRLVYDALSEYIDAGLHALAIETV